MYEWSRNTKQIKSVTYTTYEVFSIINQTKSVDELRIWAGTHGVHKTNGYVWSPFNLDKLLSEYNIRERLSMKKSHKVPFNDGEKEYLVLCSIGKNANTYSIDIGEYLSIISIDEQIQIKKNKSIPLSENEIQYLKDKEQKRIIEEENRKRHYEELIKRSEEKKKQDEEDRKIEQRNRVIKNITITIIAIVGIILWLFGKFIFLLLV